MGIFLKQYILAIGRPIITIEKDDPQYDQSDAFREEMDRIIELGTRQFVFMQLIRSMITFSTNKRQAKYQILERFKQRIKSEHELEVKRIEEMRKLASKKLRDMEKKVGKYKRLKQEETVDAINKDIEAFKQKLDIKIKTIHQNSKDELGQKKERLNVLFQEVSQNKAMNLGISAQFLLEAIEMIEPEGEFTKTFPEFIAKEIERNYSKDMEPLYKNLFSILKLTPDEKQLIIQALEKSGDMSSVKLSLDEDEKAIIERAIDDLKDKIERDAPDVFNAKVIFQTRTIPIETLLNISLDSQSIHNLLCLKTTSSQTTQMSNLKADTIRAIVELNKKVNPLPKNRIIQTGKAKEKNYEKRINASMLDSILNQIQ